MSYKFQRHSEKCSYIFVFCTIITNIYKYIYIYNIIIIIIIIIVVVGDGGMGWVGCTLLSVLLHPVTQCRFSIEGIGRIVYSDLAPIGAYNYIIAA